MQDDQTQRKEAQAAENVTAEGSFYNDTIFQQQRLRLHYRHVTSHARGEHVAHPAPGPRPRVSQNLAPQLVRVTAAHNRGLQVVG